MNSPRQQIARLHRHPDNTNAAGIASVHLEVGPFATMEAADNFDAEDWLGFDYAQFLPPGWDSSGGSEDHTGYRDPPNDGFWADHELFPRDEDEGWLVLRKMYEHLVSIGFEGTPLSEDTTEYELLRYV